MVHIGSMNQPVVEAEELAELVHGLADQPGGEEDEQHAGEPEERAQVDVLAEPVDEHADDGSTRPSPSRPPTTTWRAGGGAGLGAEQEQHGLEALAGDGDEGDEQRRRCAVGGTVDLGARRWPPMERAFLRIHRIIQVSTRPASSARVPSTAGSALPSKLAWWRVWTATPATTHTPAAMPAPTQTALTRSPPAGLHQVAEEDREHQGDLEAFAERDEECCTHDPNVRHAEHFCKSGFERLSARAPHEAVGVDAEVGEALHAAHVGDGADLVVDHGEQARRVLAQHLDQQVERAAT